jgi:Protein of unknown function (DUF3800)
MNKPLATFTVYLDESGTHEGSPATVVAGYASSVRRWREFEGEWPSLLTRHGLSVLHTKEINGWRQDRRTALVGDVLRLLGEHALIGTAAIIYEADYREVYPRGERVPFFDTKYAMCFRTCMVKMSKIIRDQWPGQRVSFVLEDGNRNKGNARRIFELSKSGGRSQFLYPLGDIDFASKQEFGAVQAADLLAHSVYQTIRVRGPLMLATSTFTQIATAPTPFAIWPIERRAMESTKARIAQIYATGRRAGQRPISGS